MKDIKTESEVKGRFEEERNKEGKLLRHTTYEEDGSVSDTIDYSYSKSGVELSRLVRDKEGVQKVSFLYYYDNGGRKIKTEERGTENTLVYLYLYSHDDNKIKKTICDAQGKIIKEELIEASEL